MRSENDRAKPFCCYGRFRIGNEVWMTFSHGLAGLRTSVKTHHKFTWKAGGSFLELHLRFSFVPVLWARAVFFRFHWKAVLSRCPLEGFEGIIILESSTWTKQFSKQHDLLHKSGLQARNTSLVTRVNLKRDSFIANEGADAFRVWPNPCT